MDSITIGDMTIRRGDFVYVDDDRKGYVDDIIDDGYEAWLLIDDIYEVRADSVKSVHYTEEGYFSHVDPPEPDEQHCVVIPVSGGTGI